MCYSQLFVIFVWFSINAFLNGIKRHIKLVIWNFVSASEFKIHFIYSIYIRWVECVTLHSIIINIIRCVVVGCFFFWCVAAPIQNDLWIWSIKRWGQEMNHKKWEKIEQKFIGWTVEILRKLCNLMFPSSFRSLVYCIDCWSVKMCA